MSNVYIILANYGDPSIALIQWASSQALAPVSVVSIDTGWAAKGWGERVKAGEAFAQRCGFTAIRLKSQFSFAQQVQDRQEFPSQKFQWCAGFLKGLPFLDWLDEVDPHREGTILLGKRSQSAGNTGTVLEFIEESPHFGERKLWHPMANFSEAQYNDLILQSGFIRLDHRSLECDPCVHSRGIELRRLAQEDINKTQQLEKTINRTMFQRPIATIVQTATESTENIEMGCGTPFACGE